LIGWIFELHVVSCMLQGSSPTLPDFSQSIQSIEVKGLTSGTKRGQSLKKNWAIAAK
jgi:hypothetical protein